MNPSFYTLSIIVPCYNEEKTLKKCVEKIFEIQDEQCQLEIIIVDDCSKDQSPSVASTLADNNPKITFIQHAKNQGKGAAIRTGMKVAIGDYLAIQDADLEYNPQDLKRIIQPLLSGDADVVIGSRFHNNNERRVLYFWHSLGNRFLTFMSNMFTDLDLTDMETCYKVFRRNKIQDIEIQEDRFGFEPEIIAKIAHKKLRIYEMGISYHGRTYEEGKKIGWKDGMRALYCIFHYNTHQLPTPMQLLIYFFIGGFAALVNLVTFIILFHLKISIISAAAISFVIAAIVNYFLCINFLFKHQVRWQRKTEIFMYMLFVLFVGCLDVTITRSLSIILLGATGAKAIASLIGFLINFAGRKYFIFKQ